ncbi:MAG: DNA-3-methyladenine glycosylase [Pseudomonadota bacterium]
MLVEHTTPVVRGQQINEDFFSGNIDEAAIALIGATIVNDREGIEGQIIETEAYCQSDPAAHCFQLKKERERLRKGRPPRMHDAMYGPAGNVYIYPSNGDWCALNFVCGEKHYGAGILIRAIKGFDFCIEKIRAARSGNKNKLRDNQLSAGPFTVCRALRIPPSLNDKKLTDTNLKLFLSIHPPQQVIAAARFGVVWNSDKHGPHLRRRYIMPGMSGYIAQSPVKPRY